MIYSYDRPGYQKPAYHPGQTPPFTAPSEEVSRKPVNVEAELARWQKPRPKPKTPYTNAYVRDLDGALMIELPGWGTFVSETWAVAQGYLSAPSKSEEALAARQEARKDRKAGQKTEKQKAYARKQQRVAKAREREINQ